MGTADEHYMKTKLDIIKREAILGLCALRNLLHIHSKPSLIYQVGLNRVKTLRNLFHCATTTKGWA
jgi:hypothetical protein